MVKYTFTKFYHILSFIKFPPYLPHITLLQKNFLKLFQILSYNNKFFKLYLEINKSYKY